MQPFELEDKLESNVKCLAFTWGSPGRLHNWFNSCERINWLFLVMVLMDVFTIFFHIFWCFVSYWLPWMSIILNRFLTSLETCMPLKNLCSFLRNIHQNLDDESLLTIFTDLLSFTQNLMQTNRKVDIATIYW